MRYLSSKRVGLPALIGLSLLGVGACAEAGGPDTSPPVVSDGQPSGILPAGTTQATMRVTTDEAATCRWGTSASTAYASLPNTFTTTGGTSHSTTLTGLTDGQSYTRYVRCQDGTGNANASSYTISFSVASGGGTGGAVAIPTSAEWTYRGAALTPSAGKWDQRLPAGAPATMLKLGSTYYLYYVGASGNRPSDGGPAYRAVGLATSSDGISWTKHPSNPVVPYSELNEYNDDEEGAWRAAAFRDEDGTIVLYVTKLVGFGGGVNGGVSLFTSSDGVSFTEYVGGGNYDWLIDPYDANFPAGDELGMLGAAREPSGGDYHLYYTGKGLPLNWDLVETNASTRDGYTSGTMIVDLSNEIRYGSNPIQISTTDWVIPVGTYPDNNIRIYRTSDLTSVGTLAETYGDLPSGGISGRGNFALYLDRDVGTWFLLIATGATGDNYADVKVWTAPATLTDGP